MDQIPLDFLRVMLVLHTSPGVRIKVTKLRSASDIVRTLSSFATLKELIYKYFPEVAEVGSGKIDLEARSKAGSRTSKWIEVKWKDPVGNLILLENDEDLEAVDLVQHRNITLHIEILMLRVPKRGSNKELSAPVAIAEENVREKAGETSGKQPGEKPRENSKEKTWENLGEKPRENSGEETGEKVGEKPRENSKEKPWENSMEKPWENSKEKPWENSKEKPCENSGGKLRENSREEPGENSGEKLREKSGTTSEEESAEKPEEKTGETPGEEKLDEKAARTPEETSGAENLEEKGGKTPEETLRKEKLEEKSGKTLEETLGKEKLEEKSGKTSEGTPGEANSGEELGKTPGEKPTEKPRQAARDETPGEKQWEKQGEKSSGLASTRYKTKPCKYFQFGHCRKGEACTFLHDEGPNWQSKDSASSGSKIQQVVGFNWEQSAKTSQKSGPSAAESKRRVSVDEPAKSITVLRRNDVDSNRREKAFEPRWHPIYIANRAVESSSAEFLLVVNQCSHEIEAKVPLASAEELESATQAAVNSFPEMAAIPSHKRKVALQYIAEALQRRSDEMARMITLESGTAIKRSRLEVLRSIETFEAAAEESTRIHGEHLNFDATARYNGRQGIVRKFPIGAVALSSPCNFSLTFLAEKLASALAVGCTFVLQPHSRALLPALILGEILESCKMLPKGSFSIIPMSASVAREFKYDERFKLFAFAGSEDAEWGNRARPRMNKMVVEQGGSAICVVEDLVPDLEGTLASLMNGAYFQGEHACYIREGLYEQIKVGLLNAVSKFKMGDPFLDETDLGPMITQAAAEGVEEWINDVTKKGWRCLTGGNRHGAFVEPTVFENVPRDAEGAFRDWSQEELLRPVLLLYSYEGFKEVVAEINDTYYGFQAGVFTSDITKAFYAFENLVGGGVLWNDCPSWRVNCQSCGGLADSELPREGLRHEMEDMLERKVFVMHNPGLM